MNPRFFASIVAVLVATTWPNSPASAITYQLDLTQFATHTGSNAIDVVSPRDGSGRVFVSTQSGQIFSYDQNGGLLGTFADLTLNTGATGFTNGFGGAASFRGLMYFDFHPDYANPGTAGHRKVYTGFQSRGIRTADYARTQSGQHYVIGEWEVSAANPNQIVPGSYREVVRVATDPGNAHALGEVAFNPLSVPGDDDYGLLYAALGDASGLGNVNPAGGYIQNLDNPFGTIMRINPLQNGPDRYSVPASNPFNNGGPLLDNDGRAEEVYAIGLRDPQTFTFAKDANGQNVLITYEIGAALRDEISLVRLGGNYGWERYEGTHVLNPGRSLVSGTTHSPPVLQFEHPDPERFAIIGGVLASDPNDPNFQNQVVFGDLVSGRMFHVDYQEMLLAEQLGTEATVSELDLQFNGSTGTMADILGSARGDPRFGVDEQGHVFIVSKRTDIIFKTGLIASVIPEPGTGLALALAGAFFCSRRRSPHH